MNREEMIAVVEASQRQLVEAMAELDDAALVEPGVVERWSVKDLIGHVTAWEQLVIQYFERWRRGEPQVEPTWNSADEYNAQEAAARQEWPLTQVRDEAAASRLRLRALLDGITEQEWTAPIVIRGRERSLSEWIGGALSGDEGPGTHAAEHAQQIRAWRTARENSRQ